MALVVGAVHCSSSTWTARSPRHVTAPTACSPASPSGGATARPRWTRATAARAADGLGPLVLTTGDRGPAEHRGHLPKAASPTRRTPASSSASSATRPPRPRTVALVGDSHAFMWFSAFDRLAERAHWKVVTYSRSSCPFTLARRTLPSEAVDTFQRLCENANDIVLDRLVADTSIDTVFVAAFSSAYGWTSVPGGRLAHPAVDGFHAGVGAASCALGKQVVVLRDVPGVKDLVNTPDCLDAAPGRRDGLRQPPRPRP